MSTSIEDLMRAPTREQLDERQVATPYNPLGENTEQKDPKYTLNFLLHPIRFCRTIRDGIAGLKYLLEGPF